jgi:hypothetical protein
MSMRSRGVLAGLLLLIAGNTFAAVAVKRSQTPGKIDVAIIGEPLTVAVKALQPFLSRRVEVLVSKEMKATFGAKRVDPEAALSAVVLSAGAQLVIEDDRYWIREKSEPAVTLDVKDEDIHAILRSMKSQCEIKNLVIDPDVRGKGTFLFDKVPCRTAFDVVFRTLGLASVDYGNSVVTVGTRRR